MRLERAARLLPGSDLPVKSIATRPGYSSRSSFTRAFVASRGIDPTALSPSVIQRRIEPPDTTSGRPDIRDDRYAA